MYIGEYLIKAPKAASLVIVSYMSFTIVSIPFWTRLSKRIGKKKALSRGLMLSTVILAMTTYYHEGTWIFWIVMGGFAGLGYGCMVAISPSMMADVVDLDELNTGIRREGAYFGVWHFLDKAAMGLTTFIGLQALDYLGYVPNQEQTVTVLWGMKFLYCVLPAICMAVGVIVVNHFPIDQQEHQRIREEIDAKTPQAAVPT